MSDSKRGDIDSLKGKYFIFIYLVTEIYIGPSDKYNDKGERYNDLIWNRFAPYHRILGLKSSKLSLTLAARRAEKGEARANSSGAFLHSIADSASDDEYTVPLLRKGEVPWIELHRLTSERMHTPVLLRLSFLSNFWRRKHVQSVDTKIKPWE